MEVCPTMKLHHTVVRFLLSESGAITVDWVVLVAGLIALALGATMLVTGGVEDLSGEVQSRLVAQDIDSGFVSTIAGPGIED